MSISHATDLKQLAEIRAVRRDLLNKIPMTDVPPPGKSVQNSTSDETGNDDTSEFKVGKAKGKFVIIDENKDIVAGPYDTQLEVDAALEKLNAE